jgi:hypothetical protein
VAFDPRQPPRLRPTTVAVHDDGDMPGESGKIELADEFFLFTSGLDKSLEVLEHGLIIRSTPRIVKNGSVLAGMPACQTGWDLVI